MALQGLEHLTGIRADLAKNKSNINRRNGYIEPLDVMGVGALVRPDGINQSGLSETRKALPRFIILSGTVSRIEKAFYFFTEQTQWTGRIKTEKGDKVLAMDIPPILFDESVLKGSGWRAPAKRILSDLESFEGIEQFTPKSVKRKIIENRNYPFSARGENNTLNVIYTDQGEAGEDPLNVVLQYVPMKRNIQYDAGDGNVVLGSIAGFELKEIYLEELPEKGVVENFYDQATPEEVVKLALPKIKKLAKSVEVATAVNYIGMFASNKSRVRPLDPISMIFKMINGEEYIPQEDIYKYLPYAINIQGVGQSYFYNHAGREFFCGRLMDDKDSRELLLNGNKTIIFTQADREYQLIARRKGDVILFSCKDSSEALSGERSLQEADQETIENLTDNTENLNLLLSYKITRKDKKVTTLQLTAVKNILSKEDRKVPVSDLSGENILPDGNGMIQLLNELRDTPKPKSFDYAGYLHMDTDLIKEQLAKRGGEKELRALIKDVFDILDEAPNLLSYQVKRDILDLKEDYPGTGSDIISAIYRESSESILEVLEQIAHQRADLSKMLSHPLALIRYLNNAYGKIPKDEKRKLLKFLRKVFTIINSTREVTPEAIKSKITILLSHTLSVEWKDQSVLLKNTAEKVVREILMDLPGRNILKSSGNLLEQVHNFVKRLRKLKQTPEELYESGNAPYLFKEDTTYAIMFKDDIEKMYSDQEMFSLGCVFLRQTSEIINQSGEVRDQKGYDELTSIIENNDIDQLAPVYEIVKYMVGIAREQKNSPGRNYTGVASEMEIPSYFAEAFSSVAVPDSQAGKFFKKGTLQVLNYVGKQVLEQNRHVGNLTNIFEKYFIFQSYSQENLIKQFGRLLFMVKLGTLISDAQLKYQPILGNISDTVDQIADRIKEKFQKPESDSGQREDSRSRLSGDISYQGDEDSGELISDELITAYADTIKALYSKSLPSGKIDDIQLLRCFFSDTGTSFEDTPSIKLYQALKDLGTIIRSVIINEEIVTLISDMLAGGGESPEFYERVFPVALALTDRFDKQIKLIEKNYGYSLIMPEDWKVDGLEIFQGALADYLSFDKRMIKDFELFIPLNKNVFNHANLGAYADFKDLEQEFFGLMAGRLAEPLAQTGELFTPTQFNQVFDQALKDGSGVILNIPAFYNLINQFPKPSGDVDIIDQDAIQEAIGDRLVQQVTIKALLNPTPKVTFEKALAQIKRDTVIDMGDGKIAPLFTEPEYIIKRMNKMDKGDTEGVSSDLADRIRNFMLNQKILKNANDPETNQPMLKFSEEYQDKFEDLKNEIMGIKSKDSISKNDIRNGGYIAMPLKTGKISSHTIEISNLVSWRNDLVRFARTVSSSLDMVNFIANKRWERIPWIDQAITTIREKEGSRTGGILSRMIDDEAYLTQVSNHVAKNYGNTEDKPPAEEERKEGSGNATVAEEDNLIGDELTDFELLYDLQRELLTEGAKSLGDRVTNFYINDHSIERDEEGNKPEKKRKDLDADIFKMCQQYRGQTPFVDNNEITSKTSNVEFLIGDFGRFPDIYQDAMTMLIYDVLKSAGDSRNTGEDGPVIDLKKVISAEGIGEVSESIRPGEKEKIFYAMLQLNTPAGYKTVVREIDVSLYLINLLKAPLYPKSAPDLPGMDKTEQDYCFNRFLDVHQFLSVTPSYPYFMISKEAGTVKKYTVADLKKESGHFLKSVLTGLIERRRMADDQKQSDEKQQFSSTKLVAGGKQGKFKTNKNYAPDESIVNDNIIPLDQEAKQESTPHNIPFLFLKKDEKKSLKDSIEIFSRKLSKLLKERLKVEDTLRRAYIESLHNMLKALHKIQADQPLLYVTNRYNNELKQWGHSLMSATSGEHLTLPAYAPVWKEVGVPLSPTKARRILEDWKTFFKTGILKYETPESDIAKQYYTESIVDDLIKKITQEESLDEPRQCVFSNNISEEPVEIPAYNLFIKKRCMVSEEDISIRDNNDRLYLSDDRRKVEERGEKRVYDPLSNSETYRFAPGIFASDGSNALLSASIKETNPIETGDYSFFYESFQTSVRMKFAQSDKIYKVAKTALGKGKRPSAYTAVLENAKFEIDLKKRDLVVKPSVESFLDVMEKVSLSTGDDDTNSRLEEVIGDLFGDAFDLIKSGFPVENANESANRIRAFIESKITSSEEFTLSSKQINFLFRKMFFFTLMRGNGFDQSTGIEVITLNDLAKGMDLIFEGKRKEDYKVGSFIRVVSKKTHKNETQNEETLSSKYKDGELRKGKAVELNLEERETEIIRTYFAFGFHEDELYLISTPVAQKALSLLPNNRKVLEKNDKTFWRGLAKIS